MSYHWRKTQTEEAIAYLHEHGPSSKQAVMDGIRLAVEARISSSDFDSIDLTTIGQWTRRRRWPDLNGFIVCEYVAGQGWLYRVTTRWHDVDRYVTAQRDGVRSRVDNLSTFVVRAAEVHPENPAAVERHQRALHLASLALSDN